MFQRNRRCQRSRAESLGSPRTCFSLKEISSDTFQGSWPPLECTRARSAEHEVFGSRRPTAVLVNDTLAPTTPLSRSNVPNYAFQVLVTKVKDRDILSREQIFARSIVTLRESIDA